MGFIYQKSKQGLLNGLVLLVSLSLNAQDIPYGTNDKAGQYLNVGDASIYYETYGEGSPILLLHGGMFGYISEFANYIPELSKSYKVIAVATRGHGRSELGTKPLSYDLFAEDAHKILRHESEESAIIIGFSDGAITSYLFAANYPKMTRKMVSLAGGFGSTWFHKEAIEGLQKLTPASLKEDYPDFVESRKQLMPHPEEWEKFIIELNKLNMQKLFISDESAATIACPVLILGGDRDDYFRIENFVHVYKTLPNAQMAIVPNCTHVGLIMNNKIVDTIIIPFVTK